MTRLTPIMDVETRIATIPDSGLDPDLRVLWEGLLHYQRKNLHWLPEKYQEPRHYKHIACCYFEMFTKLREYGHKKILDYGCGTGLGYLVNEFCDFDFDIVCTDWQEDWTDTKEKEAFDHCKQTFSVPLYYNNSVFDENVVITPRPTIKFDAVIFVRNHYITNDEISIDELYKKFAPLCENDFRIWWSNSYQPDHYDPIELLETFSERFDDQPHTRILRF